MPEVPGHVGAVGVRRAAAEGGMMPEIRVRLELQDFRDLVQGRVVEVKTPEGTVKIILADIGFPAMAQELSKAMREAGR